MSRLKKKAYISLDEPLEIGDEVYPYEVNLSLDRLSQPSNRDGAVIVNTMNGELYQGSDTHEQLIQELFKMDFDDNEWNELNYNLAFGSYLGNFLGAPAIVFYGLDRINSGAQRVINIVKQKMPGITIYEEDGIGTEEIIKRLATWNISQITTKNITRLVKKSKVMTLPQIGQTVNLSDDEKYTNLETNTLYRVESRDAPVVIFDGKLYMGGSSDIHIGVVYNDIAHGDTKSLMQLEATGVSLQFGYYLKDFLGYPAVIFDNYTNDIQGAANVVKANMPDALVYEVEDLHTLIRIARNKMLKVII